MARRLNIQNRIRHFITNSQEDDVRGLLKTNPHLFSYLNNIEDGQSVPDYHEQPNRDLGDLESPNLIYNVGNGVFIHIYPGTERQMYHPIEPEITPEVESVIADVMDKLTLLIGPDMGPKKADEHIELFDTLLDRVTQPSKGVFSLLNRSNGNGTISPAVKERIRYYFIREKIGLGRIQPLILDDNIEDISCVGLEPIFIEHKIFQSLESTIIFDSISELDRFVLSLTERSGRPATHMNPIVDAVLPDGSRLNAVYGTDISRKGSNFTIRKVPESPLSITQLIAWKGISSEIAAYIWMCLDNGMSVFVVGETASGKTTLLNACLAFIKPDSKIVSIEDTPEVIVPHKNWAKEVTRPASAGSSIDTFDLLKAGLRQRPNYIIIGEIRGVEGNTAFQAMMTGHPVISTFHAGTVKSLINRLTGSPIDVPPHYIKFLDLVLIQNAVHAPNGKLLRRLISANELVGYSPKTGNFSFVNVGSWDARTDTHSFLRSSHILENKVAPKRGIARKDIKLLYVEHERRVQILNAMISQGTFHYDKVWDVIRDYKLRGELPDDIKEYIDENMRTL